MYNNIIIVPFEQTFRIVNSMYILSVRRKLLYIHLVVSLYIVGMYDISYYYYNESPFFLSEFRMTHR